MIKNTYNPPKTWNEVAKEWSWDCPEFEAALIPDLLRIAGLDPEANFISSWQLVAHGQRAEVTDGYCAVVYSEDAEMVYLFRDNTLVLAYAMAFRGMCYMWAIIGDRNFRSRVRINEDSQVEIKKDWEEQGGGVGPQELLRDILGRILPF